MFKRLLRGVRIHSDQVWARGGPRRPDSWSKSWILDMVKSALVIACVPGAPLTYLPNFKRYVNFEKLSSSPPQEGVNQVILAANVPFEIQKVR